MSRYQRPRTHRNRWFTLRVQRRNVSSGRVVIVTGLVFVVFVVVVICVAVLHRQEDTGFASAELLPSGGDVRLAAKTFDDGQAHFYRYTTAGGREIRFFVIKTSDGVVRTALDSCGLCYKQRRGYRQAGHVMVCNNCGRTLPLMRVNVVQGACNPGPLERAVEGDQVLLNAASLELGAAYF
jgi:uncharacterized membrane protein